MPEKRQTHLDSTRETGLAAVSMVPGVVDGLITTMTDPVGSVSLQIRIKTAGAAAEDYDHIEVILGSEHTESLGRLLLAAQRPAAADTVTARHPVPVIPCSVGVRPQIPV